MAKDGGRGGEVMGPAELKPLLHLAKRKAVSCAIGMTKDKQGVILLHKRTKPRKLMAELLRQAKGSGLELDRTTIRFGRASVDGGSDSSSVTFTVNKGAPGPLRMALIAKLRPAGFQRCEIVVDEAIENESDEDEPEEGEEAAATPPGQHQDASPAPHSAATLDAPATASPPVQGTALAAVEDAEPAAGTSAGATGQAMAAQPDDAALKTTLRGLAEQIRPVVAADPSRAAALVKLASSARDSLAAGDLAAAQAGIDSLRQQFQPGGDRSPNPSAALLTPALFSGTPAEPVMPAAPRPPAPAFAPPASPAPGLAADGAAEVVGEGIAEAAGPVLLRFALGGFAFIAALVIPTNTQRVSRGAAVDGRSDLGGTVTTAPGSLSGRVTIRLHGQHGQPDRELGTFAMDPGGKLTDGGHGPVLGTATAGGIHLTPEGEAELLKRAGGGTGPAALGAQQPDGTPNSPGPAPVEVPTSPPPDALPQPSPALVVPPDLPVQYDRNDPEEAELVASMHGRSGMEIQNAINELRERRRGQGAGSTQGGSTGAGTPPNNGLPALQPTIPLLPKVSSRDIEDFRARIGVPATNTVGVARTNVSGLENTTFEGGSTLPRREGGLPPTADGPILSPNRLAINRNHAEQDIANQFVSAVDTAGLNVDDLVGRELLMRIQNSDGICTICRQGLRNPNVPPGVLKQLSTRYPGLRIHVVVDNPGPNLLGPSDFVILNGEYMP